MMEEREDNEQFKMRMEAPNEVVEEQTIPAEINELKLEKISQRVTLISILIPVLIVIVLVITYLDIKKRVTQTEDTGNIEFQKLSGDLESRFSSLSVRQARIEDAMEKLNTETNQASAAVQVRLEKLDEAIKKSAGSSVKHKDFDATKAELVKQLNEVVDATNEAGQQVAAITQTLKSQVDQLAQSLDTINAQVANLEKSIAAVRENKIDKPSMDLALRLEALKIQNELKVQFESLQSQIDDIGNRLSTATPKRTTPATTAAPQVPATATTPSPKKAPQATTGTSSTQIEEQTINK